MKRSLGSLSFAFKLGLATLAAGFGVASSALANGGLEGYYKAATDVPVTASSYDATGLNVNLELRFDPAPGTTLTVVNNTGIDFIQGTFANLAQGQKVDLRFHETTYQFVANYFGGTGNDLVLQWANSKLVAWGANSQGLLGNGQTTDSPVPVEVDTSGVLFGKTIIAMATSGLVSLAVCSDGTVAAWGDNQYGQLGNRTTVSSSVPVLVNREGVLANKTVVAVSAGWTHCLALCSDGTVAAWGSNPYRQLGIGDSRNIQLTPKAVLGFGGVNGYKAVAISAGEKHSLALTSTGVVLAWGDNTLAQLGDSNRPDFMFPDTSSLGTGSPSRVLTTTALAGKSVEAIRAGNNYSIAQCADGSIATWGVGLFFSRGRPVNPQPVAPIFTGSPLDGKSIIMTSCGYNAASLLASDGTLADWNGDRVTQIDTSGALAGKTITSLSAGMEHTLALCSDGTLVAWGQNRFGQLGTRGPSNRISPTFVDKSSFPVGSRFMAASAGENATHSLGLVGLPQTPRTSPGSFSGIVTPISGTTTDGYISATVLASGTFTGKLIFEGDTLPFAGQFKNSSTTGIAEFGPQGMPYLSISRGAKPAIQLSITRNTLYPFPENTLTGDVRMILRTGATNVASFTANRSFYDGKTPLTTVPLAYLNPPKSTDGTYNFIMPAKPPAVQPSGLKAYDYPQGTGFGSAKISRAGVVSLTGKLADGTPFTASSALTNRDAINFTFLSVLYNKGGFIDATVALDSTQKESDFAATSVRWSRPFLGTQHYPYGWPEVINTELRGAKFTSPYKKSVLDTSNFAILIVPVPPPGPFPAKLVLDDGISYTPMERNMIIAPTEAVTKMPYPASPFTIAINHATGLVSGTFTQADGTRPTFQGTAYQKGLSSGAHGYYLTTTPKVKTYDGKSGRAKVVIRL